MPSSLSLSLPAVGTSCEELRWQQNLLAEPARKLVVLQMSLGSPAVYALSTHGLQRVICSECTEIACENRSSVNTCLLTRACSSNAYRHNAVILVFTSMSCCLLHEKIPPYVIGGCGAGGPLK